MGPEGLSALPDEAVAICCAGRCRDPEESSAARLFDLQPQASTEATSITARLIVRRSAIN